MQNTYFRIRWQYQFSGFLVDVGNIDVVEQNQDGKRKQKNLEVDFIARKGRSKKYYIQSALSMDDESKALSELRPLKAIDDSFKKIIISKSYGKSWTDSSGILTNPPWLSYLWLMIFNMNKFVLN